MQSPSDYVAWCTGGYKTIYNDRDDGAIIPKNPGVYNLFGEV